MPCGHGPSVARFDGSIHLRDSQSRRQCAPLLEITPFRKNWREQRKTLVAVAHGIEDGSLPLTVADGASEIETPMSLEMLKNLIQHFRHIELETQAQMILENGEIDDPSAFISTQPDWTC